MWPVRFAGPYGKLTFNINVNKFLQFNEFYLITSIGQWLVTNLRSDILKKYEPVLGDQSIVIGEYIFQCNSQRAT